mgnify:CR=1 FL=1
MPLILGTNSIKDTGYDVANSLRFNDGDSANLSRTQVSGNRQTFTFSTWVKRSTLGTDQMLFNAGSSTDFRTMLRFGDADVLQFFNNDSTGGGVNMNLKTNRLFRDLSAWYHIVLRFDPTQSTEAHRIRLYVNGVEETSFSTATYPSQNADNTQFNHGSVSSVKIGGSAYSDADYFDGYMAEVVFCDGSSLDPTSFGEFDSDSPTIWKPIDVSGLTFGNNGFYLDFENSGALGTDVSGEGHNWTANNLAATDQSTDTCTNNFCTLNPLDRSRLSSDGTTFTEGNLKTTDGSSNNLVATGTMAVTQGKWYFEVKIDATASNTVSGVKIVDLDGWDRSDGAANTAFGWLYAPDGDKRNNGTSTSYGDTYAANDIIGVAIDMDNLAVYFSKNGVFQNSGDPTSGASKTNAAYTNLTGTITAQVYDGVSSQAHEFSMNFGSPAFSISSGNSDSEGFGNFEYAVPSGYFALCSKNLAEYG